MWSSLFFVIWFSILVVVFIVFCRQESGLEAPIFQRGYGRRSESVDVLLDRIDWSNHYKGRISPFQRNLILTLLFTPVVIIVATNAPPSPKQCIQTGFVLLILLQALYYYIDYHSEKFPHYAIDRNVNILRKKLGLVARPPPISTVKQPSWGPGQKFGYRSK